MNSEDNIIELLVRFGLAEYVPSKCHCGGNRYLKEKYKDQEVLVCNKCFTKCINYYELD